MGGDGGRGKKTRPVFVSESLSYFPYHHIPSNKKCLMIIRYDLYDKDFEKGCEKGFGRLFPKVLV
ncbi:MAG: hypothetical protein HZB62_16525 [Nitrospirae bacterium]|nr:hypothetical protein [Nitrospirota bacterium]